MIRVAVVVDEDVVVVRVVVDHAVAEAGQRVPERGEAALPAREQGRPARIGHGVGVGGDHREAAPRPPTGTGDGRPDGRSRRAPAAVRPRTRPRSTSRAGERSAGGTVASGRPGSHVRTPDQERRPGRVRADGPQVAAVRRRNGQLARDAGRGEPAPSRRAGARGRPDPRSRSRPSGRTGPRRPPRRPSCGRARSAGAQAAGDPPALGEDRARPASGSTVGRVSTAPTSSLTGASLSDAIGRPRRRSGSGEPEIDEAVAEPAADLGQQVGVVGDRPGELHRQRRGAVRDRERGGRRASRPVAPGRGIWIVSMARISRSGAAPPKRTWSTWPGRLSICEVGASDAIATRSRASSGRAGSSSASGRPAAIAADEALRLDVGRDRVGRRDRRQGGRGCRRGGPVPRRAAARPAARRAAPRPDPRPRGPRARPRRRPPMRGSAGRDGSTGPAPTCRRRHDPDRLA